MLDKEAAVAVTTAFRSVLEQIVNEPEHVRIVMSVMDEVVTLDVRVAPGDVGRVIGRAGATASALRGIVVAMGNRMKARYELRLPAGPGREGKR